jgi:hypothetical protein
MALPSSGEISISDILTEGGIDPADFTNISLNDLESGVVFTVNTSSSSYPSGSTPNSISEWYSYDHGASASYDNGSKFYSIGSISRDTDRDLYNRNTGSAGDSGNAISISMWVAPLYTNTTDINHILMELRLSNTSTNDRIFVMYDYGLERMVARYRGNSINARGTHWNLSSNSTQTGISSGKWNGSNKGNVNSGGLAHLVFTYDPSGSTGQDSWEMYWNGSKLTSKLTNLTSTQFTFNLDYIALNGQTNGGSNSRYCSYDSVAVYSNKLLSQSEITSLYNSGAGGSPVDILDDNLYYYDDFEGSGANPLSGSDYSTTWTVSREDGTITDY